MSGAWEWLFGNEPIRWIQQLIGLGHPLPFRIFSLLGDTWGVMLVVGLALWLFGRRAAYPVVGIVVVGAATKVGLSTLFHQDRPQGPGIVVYEHLDVGSFPSGHVYEAVGPWGLLFALGFVPLWVPVLVAVLVGLGRLYLGVHYVGDVLGGIFFGALLVWAYARLWPRLRGWFGRRGRRFYTVLSLAAVGGTLAWMAAAGAHPRRYEVFGMIIAAAIGLAAEHRFLRYAPERDGWSRDALRVLIGVSGIVACLLWDRSQPEQALLTGTIAAGLATLWAVLGGPAVMAAMGLGRRGAAPENRDSTHSKRTPNRERI